MRKKKTKEKRNSSINCRTTEEINNLFDKKARQAGMSRAKLLDQFITEGKVIILPFGEQITATIFFAHREISKLPNTPDKQKLHDAVSELICTINDMKDKIQKSCL